MNRVEITGTLKNMKQFENETYKKLDFIVEMIRNVKTNKIDKIDCTAWNDKAVSIYESFKENDEITIIGSLHKDCWKDRSGAWQSRVYVTVSEFNGNINNMREFSADTFEIVNQSKELPPIIEDDLPF